MSEIRNKNMKWWLGTGSCILLFVFIGIFVYAKMNFVWRGVRIIAELEKNTDSNVVTIRGQAEKAIYLTLNGREIFIDKEGNFKEYVAPLSGYSVITLFAKDKFGKTALKKFELFTNDNLLEDASSIASEESVEVPPSAGQATSEENLLESN